ncbi:MAG: hypothetical protein ACLGGX_00615 [Bdellovibrionia bacterium]
MKNVILFLTALTLPSLTLAAGGHHGDGVPVKTIIYQLINVTILFSAIIYFAKDTIKQLFIDRKSNYLAAAQKSAAAREEAEKNFADLKAKIQKLDSTKDEELKKAEQNAIQLKAQIINEAQALTQKIKDEASLTVKLETQKAEVQLRNQLLNESVAAAKMILAKDINANDHERLQSEFVKHVEAVNP